MRSRAVLAFSVIAMAVIVLVPQETAATVTHDPYEVQPGAYIPLKLQGMDEKGDRLELTIVFKGITSDDYEPRGIDVYILEEKMANQVTNDLRAEMSAIYQEKNFSERQVIEVENPKNAQMSVLFFNRIRGNDTENDSTWDNASVMIRLDYDVFEAQEESGTNIFPYIGIGLGIIFILIVIFILITFIKRRGKDATTFFNPEEGPYYAFKSIIDDKIYYLDPDQYAKLYNSNSLGEYDYMGTASRVGGTIMPPDDVSIEAVSSMPMEGQMMTAVPLDGGQPPVDISTMEATPVDPTDAVQETADQEYGTDQDMYSEDLYGQYRTEETGESGAVPQQEDEPSQDIPMNGEPHLDQGEITEAVQEQEGSGDPDDSGDERSPENIPDEGGQPSDNVEQT